MAKPIYIFTVYGFYSPDCTPLPVVRVLSLDAAISHASSLIARAYKRGAVYAKYKVSAQKLYDSICDDEETLYTFNLSDVRESCFDSEP